MKICMTHYAFYPTTGGVESHLLDLCQELVKQGHEVHTLVGTLEGRPAQEEVEGVQITREELMNPEWIRSRKEEMGKTAEVEVDELRDQVRDMYSAFIDKHDIEVVHGHNFHHFVPEHGMALTELWRDGLPNVLTVHEVWSEFICEDLLERARWDSIITFCDHVTHGLKEQAPHLDNIVKVFPGIDVQQFSPQNQNDKWADKLALHDRPVILHPARMLPWKGVLYSIRAMTEVKKEFPKALLIVTDTEDIVDWIRELKGYKEQVLAEIQHLGLVDNVITQPFPYVELPWVYNHCDVVIYPTIGEEPFGLVPVEAMACAKPTVVTRSGGMVESVIDAENGYIIEKKDPEALADRILRFLRDPDLAAQFGQAGRQRAEQVFSRERMAQETAAVYARACEQGRERQQNPVKR